MTSVEGIKTNRKGIIKDIIEYLDDNYTEMYCRKDLAEKFGIQNSYLCRLFKELMNISITEYINAKRIELVKELLLDSGNKVIDIAYHVGFTNLSNFHRIFKKHTGFTPFEYKQRTESQKLAASAG